MFCLRFGGGKRFRTGILMHSFASCPIDCRSDDLTKFIFSSFATNKGIEAVLSWKDFT